MSHINAVKSTLTGSNTESKKSLNNSVKKQAGAEKANTRVTKDKDYAREARLFLSKKKARIAHRVQLTNLAQPAKKNRKKLKKLVQLAKKI